VFAPNLVARATPLEAWLFDQTMVARQGVSESPTREDLLEDPDLENVQQEGWFRDLLAGL
jgi:hypothetical protein